MWKETSHIMAINRYNFYILGAWWKRIWKAFRIFELLPSHNKMYNQLFMEGNFLDVSVRKKYNQLVSHLNVKPTDTHQYLFASSSHIYHSQRYISYSQAIDSSNHPKAYHPNFSKFKRYHVISTPLTNMRPGTPKDISSGSYYMLPKSENLKGPKFTHFTKMKGFPDQVKTEMWDLWAQCKYW